MRLGVSRSIRIAAAGVGPRPRLPPASVRRAGSVTSDALLPDDLQAAAHDPPDGREDGEPRLQRALPRGEPGRDR